MCSTVAVGAVMENRVQGGEGGRRKDQEGGLVGSEQLAAVGTSSRFALDCVRRERKERGGHGLPVFVLNGGTELPFC